MMRYSVRKMGLAVLGTVSLVLGLVGIFIPVLPTTPFLLLASFCYLRSSKKMYDWLIHHPYFGSYIYGYITYKAVSRKTKRGALIFLWLTLILSMILVAFWHVRVFLLLVGLGVTWHLLTLKTLGPKEETEACDQQGLSQE